MIENIECMVFDLDGTLFSSDKTIYYATLKTFEMLGQKVEIDEEIFSTKIGLHFMDIFNQMNIKVDDVEHFIDVYKTIYFDFVGYTKPYSYLYEMLEDVYQRGIKICLLTTKAQEQAELILNHFNIAKYFSIVIGRRAGMKIKPSPEPLQYVMNELNIKKDNLLMVGDSEMDVLCGINAGTKTCAVTYGYRSKEELLKLNPDYIIDSLEEIKLIK